jgi:hypothetical protein
MYDSIVCNGNIVPNAYRRYFISAMNHDTILYVYIVTYPDAVHIPPDDGIKPYAAVITDDHISHNRGIIRKETILAQPGIDSVNRFYEGHTWFFYW